MPNQIEPTWGVIPTMMPILFLTDNLVQSTAKAPTKPHKLEPTWGEIQTVLLSMLVMAKLFQTTLNFQPYFFIS